MAIAPSMADVRDELLAIDPELLGAREAVFTPTPLDLLSIAQLFHTDLEYALKLASAAGRAFDEEHAR